MPYVGVVLAGVQLFFLTLNNFVASPFQVLGAAGANGALQWISRGDGQGLNPLLQYPEMVIHPPMLYSGYTGFAIPFAFALARAAGPLSRREVDSPDAPLDHDRLGLPGRGHSAGRALGLRGARLGRLLGLGPGGERLADAVADRHGVSALGDDAGKARHDARVERLAGVHHVPAHDLRHLPDAQRRGQFRARLRAIDHRPVVLRLHRAGACWFAWWLTGAIATTCAATISSIRMVSRESSFLFNNLILLVACVAVLSGTLFPVLSEWVRGTKISVGAPFFNKVNLPIGLFLLFLTGVGPLLAWRKTSIESLRRNFGWPLLVGIVAGDRGVALGLREFLRDRCA